MDAFIIVNDYTNYVNIIFFGNLTPLYPPAKLSNLFIYKAFFHIYAPIQDENMQESIKVLVIYLSSRSPA